MFIFNGGEELCLATVSTMKSMLIVRQEFVLVVVGINYMLKNFADYTCARYRSIVGGVMLVSFLGDNNHISRLPVIREAGIMLGSMDFWNSSTKIGARTVLHSFRTRVGMRSGPVTLLQSSPSSNFLIPLG